MTSLQLLNPIILAGRRSPRLWTNGAPPRSCLNVDVRALDQRMPAAESQEVIEAEKRVMVGTYNRPPLVIASGKGCKLYDPEGREYLDLMSGIAVNALGHGDPDWIRAVTEQAHVLTHVSNVYYSIPQRLEGCRTLAEGTKAIINLGLEKVHVPGEPGFPLPSLFPLPQSDKEADNILLTIKRVRLNSSKAVKRGSSMSGDSVGRGRGRGVTSSTMNNSSSSSQI